jgi:hypothetical protein
MDIMRLVRLMRGGVADNPVSSSDSSLTENPLDGVCWALWYECILANGNEACFTLASTIESRRLRGETGGVCVGIAGGTKATLDVAEKGARSVLIMPGGRDRLPLEALFEDIDRGVVVDKAAVADRRRISWLDCEEKVVSSSSVAAPSAMLANE